MTRRRNKRADKPLLLDAAATRRQEFSDALVAAPCNQQLYHAAGMNTTPHRSRGLAGDSTERAFRTPPTDAIRRRWRGCMLGGGVGDALGAPVEFMSLDEIRERFGAAGVTDMTTAFERPGAITDDTQMTLFTADGLLRAHIRQSLEGSANVSSIVAHAYQRWLMTQEKAAPLVDRAGDQGWLIEQRELFAARIAGHTCIAALASMPSLGAKARNDSKGCGGVMRMAPVGLFCAREPGSTDQRAARRAFDLGCELAALTHGHPTGQVAAGAFAALIALIAREWEVDEAVDEVLPLVRKRSLGAETSAAIKAAVVLSRSGAPTPEKVATLGEGWIAEQALAIAIYAALVTHDFTSGVLVAVNHSGDSDSTGAIAGNLIGALRGVDNIPRKWLSALDAGATLAAIADDLATYPEWPVGEFLPESEAATFWRMRYPPV